MKPFFTKGRVISMIVVSTGVISGLWASDVVSRVPLVYAGCVVAFIAYSAMLEKVKNKIEPEGVLLECALGIVIVAAFVWLRGQQGLPWGTPREIFDWMFSMITWMFTAAFIPSAIWQGWHWLPRIERRANKTKRLILKSEQENE